MERRSSLEGAVPQGLISFMTNHTPDQLETLDYLANDALRPPSPRSTYSTPSQSWPSLSRRTSIEALESLAEMGAVDRQRSIDRLPVVGPAVCPSKQLRRIGEIMSRRLVVQRRLQNLRNYRLQRRMQNAARTSNHKWRSSTSEFADRCSETSAIAIQLPAVKRCARAAAPSKAQVLRKMIGHDLPYRWQLAHEVMVNDDFQFEPHGMVLPQGQQQVVALLLAAQDAVQQRELSTALQILSGLGDDEAAAEEATVDRTFQQLRVELAAITEADQASTAALSTSGVVQMVRHGAYGPEQLARLIIHVVERALGSCLVKQHSVAVWLPEAVAAIRQAACSRRTKSTLPEIAPRALHGLLNQLKMMRTLEMNAKLASHRLSFQAAGAEFERELVSEVVAEGNLELHRTASWLDEAHTALQAEQPTAPLALSRATMVAVHRRAFRSLLVQLALRNSRIVSASKVPEILALDSSRLANFRCQLRRLAVGGALFTFVKSMLNVVGITLDVEAAEGLQEKILVHIGELNQSEALCTAVAAEAQKVAGDALVLPDTFCTGLRAALKRKQVSLRVLFTERIGEEIVSHDHTAEQVHKSLSSIRGPVHELAKQVDKLCSYLEQAYAQLYTALLKSKGERGGGDEQEQAIIADEEAKLFEWL